MTDRLRDAELAAERAAARPDNELSPDARSGRTDLDPEFARAIEPDAGRQGDTAESGALDPGGSGALDPGERYGQGTDASHPDSATGQEIERVGGDEETAWKSTA